MLYSKNYCEYDYEIFRKISTNPKVTNRLEGHKFQRIIREYFSDEKHIETSQSLEIIMQVQLRIITVCLIDALLNMYSDVETTCQKK